MSKKKKKGSRRSRSRSVQSRPSPAQFSEPKPITQEATAPLPRRAVGFILLSVATLFVFLIYANSLHGPFLFDDTDNIRDNSAIKIISLGFDSLKTAAFESPHPRRFVSYLSFAFNYYFHQDQMLGYHLVNVLIHLVASLLVFQLVRVTLSLPSLRGCYPRSEEIAFFVALLWLVHPMAAQSVAYLVQRMNSLATLFYLASLDSYIYGRLAAGNARLLWFFACGVSALLALGSKENAATLPFFIVLYE